MERHGAHQQAHGGDLGQSKAQPVRQLNNGKHRHRRLQRRDRPARSRAERSDHHQQRRRQRKSRRQRKHDNFGEHPQRPQTGNRQPAKTGLLPDDGGKNVIRGVAALDQRRCEDDGEKAAVTEQRARAALDHVSLFRAIDRPEAETGQCASPGYQRDHPNQVFGRDHIDQQSARQCAHHECSRAP
jgi:hypothetical protein